MIEFKDVSVRRDGRELFSGASFQLHPNHKIGLTGNNGTGKSTLFALLLTQMGTGDTEVTLDRGEVNIPDSWQVAHMAQEVGSVAHPVGHAGFDAQMGARHPRGAAGGGGGGDRQQEAGFNGLGRKDAVVAGNVQVDGNVDASGSVMDGGGNSNHHSH